MNAMAEVNTELFNFLNTCSDEKALEAYRKIIGENDIYRAAKEKLDASEE